MLRIGFLLFAAATENHLWVTWDVFEPDSCASIWLIRRHVDPAAQIKILAKGSPITGGIPFDTPDAKLRRYALASTYETILTEYKVTDPRSVAIGKLIHDIEINKWARDAKAPSRDIEADVRRIVAETKGADNVVPKVIAYFDNLAAHIGASR